MNSWTRNLRWAVVGRAVVGRAVFGAALVAGCSNADLPTSATSTTSAGTVPAAPRFAKGGGGTAVPTQPPVTAGPTITVSSSLFPGTNGVVGQTVSVLVIAQSESGNRKAPTFSVVAPAAGFTLVSLTSVDSPHGGGPGIVQASYSYTPTRDQIGSTEAATFTATTSAGSASAVLPFGVVQDAPSALLGLVASAASDHIQVSWQPSFGGAGTITYVVKACYRNANIRTTASTCDVVATTTDLQATIPLANASPTNAPQGGVATYFTVLVTPVDAAGTPGPLGTAAVQ